MVDRAGDCGGVTAHISKRMSILFRALMSCSKGPPKPQDWPARIMCQVGPATGAIIEKWRHATCAEKWELNPPDPRYSRLVRVLGPGGFFLSISPVAIDLSHCSTWGKFLYDEEHRRELRAACVEFAQIFGSDRAIYLPELIGAGFHVCFDLDRMEIELKGTMGPPASSIDEIKRLSKEAGNTDLHDSCYYIDHFEDLRELRETR